MTDNSSARSARRDFDAFVARVAAATAGLRFSRLNEKRFQDGLAECFAAAGMMASREFVLGGERDTLGNEDKPLPFEVVANEMDRPDFYFFGGGFVVECKVDGSFHSHLRQCHRYASHLCVNGVLLAAMRPAPDAPETLCGKPFAVVNFALKCL